MEYTFCTFYFQGLKDFDYIIKAKSIFEHIFDFEFDCNVTEGNEIREIFQDVSELETNQFIQIFIRFVDRGTFYKDYGHLFNNILYYEQPLFQLEILFFIYGFILLGNMVYGLFGAVFISQVRYFSI